MNQQPASADAQPTGLSALSVAQWFYARPVFWLSIIGVLGLVALLTFQFFSSRELIEDSALESAKLYSEALSEFRTIYTSEVVETVRAQGIAVTHDYDELEHAIPLPATLSMILGERIGQHSSGAKTNLYSAYPFPWRREENRKLFDDPFLKEAWDELTRNPEKPFFTFTELTGRPVLRYATADLMRAACVNCHNTHPETPKSDWKDGDVRGVLLVDLPLERASLQAQAAMRRTGVLSLFLAALWISGLVLVIGKLRRISTELKVRVSKRTEELACSNEELERLLSRFQESEARMRKLAHYDSLTGLPNRRLFQLQMARTLELAMRRGSKLALLFLDLDRFKEVNDTFGHSVGDELLSQVAERLLKTIRHRDAVGHSDSADSEPMLCRLGGDEFTILLSRILDAQDAAKVAQRLLNTLSEPFSIAGHEVYADASVGIVVFPDDGENPETLLRNADTAMYHAKGHGRNTIQFYGKSMNAAAARRLRLGTGLRRALERKELTLQYQPVRDAVSGELMGAEALLRWNHPEEGFVSPAEFIPIAEDTGSIVRIGEWVLKTACAQSRAWEVAGFREIRMAVNVSAHQLRQPRWAERVAQILAETGLSPARLELELTETAIMQHDDATTSCIRELNEMGVGLALDDFGTGYSSLSFLRRFPIDRVKIDRSFVSEITTEAHSLAMAEAILALAESLGLKVVAEGVETVEQAELLRERGCTELQGYLFGPAVAAEEFERFLEDGKPE